MAHKYGWLDKPDHRKVHTKAIPRLGGVGMFIAFIIPVSLAVSHFTGQDRSITLTAIILIFILGIIDDKIQLKASFKLLIQLIAALIIALAGYKLDFLNDMTFLPYIPFWMLIILTVLFITTLTNAFNLIDGIDGLAGSLSTINLFISGLVLLLSQELFFALISLTMAASTIAFLRYNLNPAKIFMGDSGSLVLGFTQAIIFLKILGLNNLVITSSISFAPVLLVSSMMMIPVYDLFRVFINRIINGHSPFRPDKTHVHHLLLATGMNHKNSTNLLVIVSFILISAQVLLINLNPILSISILAIICFFGNEGINIYMFLLNKKQITKTNREIRKLKSENQFLS